MTISHWWPVILISGPMDVVAALIPVPEESEALPILPLQTCRECSLYFFGSYFGDWIHRIISCAHHLHRENVDWRLEWKATLGIPSYGLGENIGYDVRISQNNSSLYYYNYAARYIHLGLMGDPTLRNDVVAPVSMSLQVFQEIITRSTDKFSG